ncbi:hypothetical protein LAY34_27115 [Escherichia coli]|nr:hypothetical protein [Escherichia coli]
MKSIILSMVAATALLSGCADSKTQPVPESPLTKHDQWFCQQNAKSIL